MLFFVLYQHYCITWEKMQEKTFKGRMGCFQLWWFGDLALHIISSYVTRDVYTSIYVPDVTQCLHMLKISKFTKIFCVSKVKVMKVNCKVCVKKVDTENSIMSCRLIVQLNSRGLHSHLEYFPDPSFIEVKLFMKFFVFSRMF